MVILKTYYVKNLYYEEKLFNPDSIDCNTSVICL